MKLTPIAVVSRATAMASRSGDPALYIAEQGGNVLSIRGKQAPVTVLDLTGLVGSGDLGLLGLAFSPDGSKLYVDYGDTNGYGNVQIDEFTMRGRGPDASSRRPILTVVLPDTPYHHAGGQLAFGPDGYLYIAVGDGGGAGDEGPGHVEGGNAQFLGTLLGKILRIDPRPSGTLPYTVPSDNPFTGQAGALPEIWAYGLRNPWRFSFDGPTGDLWIADVGQDSWEEVDLARATNGRDAGRADNFGWNLLEGTHPYNGGIAPLDAVPPVYEYPHDGGNIFCVASVIGGYVYHGSNIPALQGMYVFGDYCNGTLHVLEPDGSGGFTAHDLWLSAESLSSFGVDTNGELYVLSQTQGVFRIDNA